MVSNVAVVPLTVQTAVVDEAKVTGKFADVVAANGSVVSAACVVGGVNVMVCVLSPTEIETVLLVVVPCDAVMDEEPCTAPVTVVPLIVTFVFDAEYCGVIANAAPYWSTPLAESVAVPPTLMDAVDIERLMDASAGGTRTIVMEAAGLEIPLAEATMVALPTPDGVNTLAIMLPLPVAVKVGAMVY